MNLQHFVPIYFPISFIKKTEKQTKIQKLDFFSSSSNKNKRQWKVNKKSKNRKTANKRREKKSHFKQQKIKYHKLQERKQRAGVGCIHLRLFWLEKKVSSLRIEVWNRTLDGFKQSSKSIRVDSP
ncbi:hypothetical protein ACKWTF_000384 [Chironomus riparius]